MEKQSIATNWDDETSNFNDKHEQKTCTASRWFVVWLNSQVIQGCSKDSFHKYLATVDVEVGNFKKIQFFSVKIEVIRRIAIHSAIHASYNAFLSGGYPLDKRFIHWIGLIHWITYPPFVQPAPESEVWYVQ